MGEHPDRNLLRDNTPQGSESERECDTLTCAGGGVLSLRPKGREAEEELAYRTAFPLILNGSPRFGNSLFAAKHCYDAYQSRAQALRGDGCALPDAEMLTLTDFTVEPCVGCGACGKAPHRCPFSGGDESADLFARLLRAPFLVVVAPIYFYGLPSQMKAFVDRFQSWYSRGEAGDAMMLTLPERPAYVMLTAGRPVGEKLFDGALLSLKYALKVFHFVMHEPLLLRGVDGAHDLRNQPVYADAVARMGESAAMDLGAVLSGKG